VRRPGAAALLLGVVLCGLPVSTPSAHADDMSRAQAKVDRLQDVARDATARLLEGTRRWEADVAALHRTQVALQNTRRHLRAQQAELARQQARVGAVARTLYMRPVPDGVHLAITRTPDEVVEALRAQGALNQAEGSQAEVIRLAVVARHALRVKEVEADSLESRARGLAAASAKRLAQLQALAKRTAGQLQDAQDALSKARAAAAEEARERARQRAARNRAATGALCTGKSAAGQANGNLDPASLCPLWRAPGQQLVADAAAAFNRMSRYHAATTGSPLCVTDSYRSYQDQVAVYQSKPGLAAVPGTSEHGWGKAVDLCGGVERAGSPAYDWMKANAPRFGWFHPDWAEPSGSRPEAWHWEFSG